MSRIRDVKGAIMIQSKVRWSVEAVTTNMRKLPLLFD